MVSEGVVEKQALKAGWASRFLGCPLSELLEESLKPGCDALRFMKQIRDEMGFTLLEALSDGRDSVESDSKLMVLDNEFDGLHGHEGSGAPTVRNVGACQAPATPKLAGYAC